ncbi:MAG: hypothetical protein JST82_16425 [Bacteroidetes bacterium]|nr:hypothetical protein [Bacteroidota bacterium]
MSTPFTLEQAKDISEDFEDLIDTTITMREQPSKTYNIVCVTPCPFHEADKELFLRTYTEENDVEKAMITYSGSEYDVLIVAHNVADNTDFVTIPIRQYIASNGIRYNFPD